MGIRFTCPKGHKLNVKEHLAGKTGFCPECGARLVIPYHSTRKSSKELREEQLAGGGLAEAASQPAAEANPGSSDDILKKPAAEPAHPTFSMTPSSFFDEEMRQDPAPMNAMDPQMNPILQDQSVVWYVQVPGGPQYGPATGQVIHSWIQQHRISANMLVWREGWANWLEAKNVFPELE